MFRVKVFGSCLKHVCHVSPPRNSCTVSALQHGIDTKTDALSGFLVNTEVNPPAFYARQVSCAQRTRVV
eukprot:3381152-Amphidinium_carterae.1